MIVNIARVIFLLVMVLYFSDASVADEKTTRIELDKILKVGQETLANKNMTEDEMFNFLRSETLKYADINTIATISIGQVSKKLSLEEWNEYLEVFTPYLGSMLADRIMIFDSPHFEVVGSRKIRTGISFTSIATDQGQTAQIDWSMTKINDDSPKMLDVVVAGASMLAAQRLEFDAVIRSKGFDHLIEVLREKGKKR